MAYYFSMEIVYWNAFAATQHITRELDREDIVWFCRRLEKQLAPAREEYPDEGALIVNYDHDDDDFFRRYRGDFCKFGDRVIFSGLPIEDDRLRRLNLCLPSQAAKEAFRTTRELFTDHMQRKRELAGIEPGTVLVAEQDGLG